ncbi:MAG: hypothetical protein ACE5R6_17425 [Candidatus Heimdallarchaeota archaeon]
MQEYTARTPFYDLDRYWTTLTQKIDAHVVVIRIKDLKWLDPVIYLWAQSYGSTWIYLGTDEK